MQFPIEIENIEELRLREGIDDVELRIAIRGLAIGDFVKITFLTGPKSFETLFVQITRIRGCAFRGKLAKTPVSVALSNLRAGSSVAFSSAQIHSIRRSQNDKDGTASAIHPNEVKST